MKKIVKQEISLCDICGANADGWYFLEENIDGGTAGEYSCPLDLCKDHMQMFMMFLDNYKGNPFKLLSERCSSISDENRQKCLTEFKKYLKED